MAAPGTTVEVREARDDDETAVIGVAMAALATYSQWSPGWRVPRNAADSERARWRKIDPAVRWLVASREGDPVGVCRWISARPAALSLLAVHPSCWDAGIGSALHDAVLGAMREESRRTVRLNVPEANARARIFYERRGWRVACRLPRTHAWLGFPMLRYARAVV